MKKPVINEAELSDAPAMADVYLYSLQGTDHSPIKAGMSHIVKDAIRHSIICDIELNMEHAEAGRHKVYTAKNENGKIKAYIISEFEKEKKKMTMWHLHAAPNEDNENSNKKISYGKFLMAENIAMAQKQGIENIMTYSIETLVGYCQKNGFEIHEEEQKNSEPAHKLVPMIYRGK